MRIFIPKKESYIVPEGYHPAAVMSFYNEGGSTNIRRLKFELLELETETERKVAAISFEFDDNGNSPFFDQMRRLFPEEFENLEDPRVFDTDCLIGKLLKIQVIQIDQYQRDHKNPYSKVVALLPFNSDSAPKGRNRSTARKGLKRGKRQS
jgi:hypothetical protein